MKTYTKLYIGKGKQVAGMSIIKCTCKMEDITGLSYEYNGEHYFTFEIAKMKQADNFGREYTLYVNKVETEKSAEPKEPILTEDPFIPVSKSGKKMKKVVADQIPVGEIPW